MRRLLALLTVVGLLVWTGCGPSHPAEHTGPAITPLTGKDVPKGMGPPGEGPAEGGPKGPPKPPGVR